MIRRILRFASVDVVVLLAIGSVAVLFSRRSRSSHIEPSAPRIASPGPRIVGEAASGLAALFPPRTTPSAADPVPTKPALRLDWGERDEPRPHRP